MNGTSEVSSQEGGPWRKHENMSSQQTSLMASPTLGKPKQGAWIPASWRPDKGPFLLYTMPHCALLWGEQCSPQPGDAEDKGPICEDHPHLKSSTQVTPDGRAVLPHLLSPEQLPHPDRDPGKLGLAWGEGAGFSQFSLSSCAGPYQTPCLNNRSGGAGCWFLLEGPESKAWARVCVPLIPKAVSPLGTCFRAGGLPGCGRCLHHPRQYLLQVPLQSWVPKGGFSWERKRN